MKALAQILFEISCTQDVQDFFSKGNNSERGHNSEKKKNTGHLFSERGHNSEKKKNTGHLFFHEEVQVGKDQEKAQSEKDSHSKNRGGKKPN